MRRRLSIDIVDGGAPAEVAEVVEDRGGLIADLEMEDTILEVLARVYRVSEMRQFSVGSRPDESKVSFANKRHELIGDEIDLAVLGRAGLGFTCRKGLKPDAPNQDSWAALKVDGSFSIYGVYDGHGRKGHDISHFVKEAMPRLIVKDHRFPTKDFVGMMKDNFRTMQEILAMADHMQTLSAQSAGTTATVVLHDHTENRLTIAHVADSTCVLGRYRDASRSVLEAITLTEDHKPNLTRERERIESAGGRVVFDGYMNHRVYSQKGRYPGLNMSRCLGDLLGHADAGCSAEPDVSQRLVTPEDHVLLVCSDGVWEFLEATEAVRIVSAFDYTNAALAAETLAKEAWDRWIREEGGAVVDDITVLIIYLQAPPDEIWCA